MFAPVLGGVLVLVCVPLLAWRLVIWPILKHPLLSVPIAIYIGLLALLGANDAQALSCYALIALGLWRVLHKHSFQRLVGHRLRSSWRRWWIYERRWQATMVLTGLGKPYRRRQRVPTIRSVHSTAWDDHVLIELIPGQDTEDITRVAPALAGSFGAQACHVSHDRPGRVRLQFATVDPQTARETSAPRPGRPQPDGDLSTELALLESRPQATPGGSTSAPLGVS